MKVTLVRHTSVDVPKGVCYGWTDVSVAASFPQEAEETKNVFQDLNLTKFFLPHFQGRENWLNIVA